MEALALKTKMNKWMWTWGSRTSLPLLRPPLLLLALTALIGAMTEETAATKLQETMAEVGRTMIVIEMAGDPGTISACTATTYTLVLVGVDSDDKLVLIKHPVHDHKNPRLAYCCLSYLTRGDLKYLILQSMAFDGVSDPCS